MEIDDVEFRCPCCDDVIRRMSDGPCHNDDGGMDLWCGRCDRSWQWFDAAGSHVHWDAFGNSLRRN